MEFNFRGWDEQLKQHMYPKDGLWSLGGRQGGGMGIYLETRKAIQRELEKERIREEILVEEIARKRDLEAEVRREMAMHGGRGFPSLISHANWFEEKFSRHCEIVDVIKKGKPNGGAKGKPASEWSCAICKVSAPCEQAFNAHLAGKKHQAQMAALKAKNTQKHATQQNKCKKQSGEIGLGVNSTTTMETESSKSNKSVKTQPPPLMKKNSSKCDAKKEEDQKKNSSKCDAKKEEDQRKNSSKCDSKKVEDQRKNSSKCDAIKEEDQRKNSSKCDSKKEEDQRKNSSKCDSKREEDQKKNSSKCDSKREEDQKKNSSKCDAKKEEDQKKNSSKCDSKKVEDQKKNSSKCDSKKEEDKKSELWFSCEMCKVGASSHEVMNAHIKGKKHLKNLLKLHQESAAAGPGTKKPHKTETEFGVKGKEGTGKRKT